MFVRRNGTYVCSLSGGCLEPAVAETAARVIASGEPAVVSYDLADDSIWGLDARPPMRQRPTRRGTR